MVNSKAYDNACDSGSMNQCNPATLVCDGGKDAAKCVTKDDQSCKTNTGCIAGSLCEKNSDESDSFCKKPVADGEICNNAVTEGTTAVTTDAPCSGSGSTCVANPVSETKNKVCVAAEAPGYGVACSASNCAANLVCETPTGGSSDVCVHASGMACTVE